MIKVTEGMIYEQLLKKGFEYKLMGDEYFYMKTIDDTQDVEHSIKDSQLFGTEYDKYVINVIVEEDLSALVWYLEGDNNCNDDFQITELSGIYNYLLSISYYAPEAA